MRRNLLLLSSAFLLGLLVLELGVRVVEPEKADVTRFLMPDPVLHHRFIPGTRGRQRSSEFDVTYAINALGLRERPLAPGKPDGARRILMLGDSFTEGLGVESEQTFCALLQARLDREEPGARWQVINAGVRSYSPLLEYIYLRTGGLDLQPDVVVLNFDLSDVHDDIRYSSLAVAGEGGDPVAVPAPPASYAESTRWQDEASGPSGAHASPPLGLLFGLKSLVKEHLHLYGFVRRRVEARVAALQKPDASGDIQKDRFALLRDSYRPADEDWSPTFRHVTLIRDLLAARGVELWVTVYPYGLQVGPDEWGTGRRVWGFERGRVYSTAPQEHMEQFCRRHGIPVVNLCPAFRDAARTVHPLYADFDGHWRPAGHALVAKALYESLAPRLRALQAPATPPRPCARGPRTP